MPCRGCKQHESRCKCGNFGKKQNAEDQKQAQPKDSNEQQVKNTQRKKEEKF